MKKVVETQEGRLGKIIFTNPENGEGIEEKKLEEVIIKKCEIYQEKGVLVHMTEKEYDFFEKVQNGDYKTITTEDFDDYLDRKDIF